MKAKFAVYQNNEDDDGFFWWEAQGLDFEFCATGERFSIINNIIYWLAYHYLEAVIKNEKPFNSLPDPHFKRDWEERKSKLDFKNKGAFEITFDLPDSLEKMCNKSLDEIIEILRIPRRYIDNFEDVEDC